MVWFAPSSPPASPGGSPSSHKPLCGESPEEKGSRSHQLPGAGMHTPRTRVSVVLLSITLDIPGWLLEGSHSLASSYLVSQQTNWSSKPLSSHRGKKKAVSIFPVVLKNAFPGTGISFPSSLPLKAACGDVEPTRTQGPPQAFFPLRRRQEQWQSQLGSETCPRLPGGLAPGQRLARSLLSRRVHLQVPPLSPWRAKQGNLASPWPCSAPG